MRILLTNDDGIHSKGIFALAKELIKFAEVIIVAPEREQSAIGHAITMHQPLRSKKINFHEMNIDAWWVSGTPADCVKLGMDFLLKEAPDVVVSGMNNGENLGKDVFVGAREVPSHVASHIAQGHQKRHLSIRDG